MSFKESHERHQCRYHGVLKIFSAHVSEGQPCMMNCYLNSKEVVTSRLTYMRKKHCDERRPLKENPGHELDSQRG